MVAIRFVGLLLYEGWLLIDVLREKLRVRRRVDVRLRVEELLHLQHNLVVMCLQIPFARLEESEAYGPVMVDVEVLEVAENDSRWVERIFLAKIHVGRDLFALVRGSRSAPDHEYEMRQVLAVVVQLERVANVLGKRRLDARQVKSFPFRRQPIQASRLPIVQITVQVHYFRDLEEISSHLPLLCKLPYKNSRRIRKII